MTVFRFASAIISLNAVFPKDSLSDCLEITAADNSCCLPVHQYCVVIVLLATESESYIGSVLFRTSAYTGSKQASTVPTGSKQNNSPHNDDVKDVSVLLESDLIGPV